MISYFSGNYIIVSCEGEISKLLLSNLFRTFRSSSHIYSYGGCLLLVYCWNSAWTQVDNIIIIHKITGHKKRKMQYMRREYNKEVYCLQWFFYSKVVYYHDWYVHILVEGRLRVVDQATGQLFKVWHLYLLENSF